MNAAIRAVFTCCGFSENAARSIVEDQGINSLLEIAFLKDAEVESLAKALRRPGGTIPDPAGVAGAGDR